MANNIDGGPRIPRVPFSDKKAIEPKVTKAPEAHDISQFQKRIEEEIQTKDSPKIEIEEHKKPKDEGIELIEGDIIEDISLDNIFHQLPCEIVCADLDANIRLCNKPFLEGTKFTLSAIEGKNLYDAITLKGDLTDEALNNFKEAVASLLVDGKTKYNVILYPDFPYRDSYRRNIGVLRNIEQEIIGFICISLSKKAPPEESMNMFKETALQPYVAGQGVYAASGLSKDVLVAIVKPTSEDDNFALKNIFAQLPCNVFWMDTDDIVLGCNAPNLAALELSEYESALGVHAYKLGASVGFLEKVMQFLQEVEAKVMKTGKTAYNIEEQLNTPNSMAKNFISNRAVFRGKNARIIGYVGVNAPLTPIERAASRNISSC